MFHPTRGGTRGGRDQFNWEDVKDDKHRENYLGHSLMAPIGRWQKGKDLTWYAKESKDDTKAKANMLEIAKIKEAEAEAMAIALGVKKKKTLESKVTEDELKRALSKGNEDTDDEKSVIDVEKGLGYGRSSRFPIQDQQQISNIEIMNAGNGSIAHPDYRHASINEKQKEKKKSKKHHKIDKGKKRHRNEDDKKHFSPKQQLYKDDSVERGTRRETYRRDEDVHRRKQRKRERRRSNSPANNDEHKNHHSRSGKDNHLSDFTRKTTYRDNEKKKTRSRSLSPYSKRVQLSKK